MLVEQKPNPTQLLTGHRASCKVGANLHLELSQHLCMVRCRKALNDHDPKPFATICMEAAVSCSGCVPVSSEWTGKACLHTIKAQLPAALSTTTIVNKPQLITEGSCKGSWPYLIGPMLSAPNTCREEGADRALGIIAINPQFPNSIYNPMIGRSELFTGPVGPHHCHIAYQPPC